MSSAGRRISGRRSTLAGSRAGWGQTFPPPPRPVACSCKKQDHKAAIIHTAVVHAQPYMLCDHKTMRISPTTVFVIYCASELLVFPCRFDASCWNSNKQAVTQRVIRSSFLNFSSVIQRSLMKLFENIKTNSIRPANNTPGNIKMSYTDLQTSHKIVQDDFQDRPAL